MRLNISLLVLICGLQQIFARYVPGFSWTGGNQDNMRQYWSTYEDDDELFGLGETKDKYDDQEYKHFVATILGEDNEDDSDEATEKASVINDNDKTSDYGFHMENLGNGITIYSRNPVFTSNTDNLFDINKSSEEMEKVEDDENKIASTDKGVKFHWSISFGYPRSQFTSGYDAITKSSEETKDEDGLNKTDVDINTDDVDSVLDLIFSKSKSSEETKDDDSLNKIDADLNNNDVDSVLDLIFGDSKSSEEQNDNMDSDHILKKIDELFKELGLDDKTDNDENNNDNDKSDTARDNDDDDSYNFMLKEVDGLLKELEEMDNNSNENDNVVHSIILDKDDDDNTNNNDDDNSDEDSDDNNLQSTNDILKEIDELLKELGIDDNTNEDKDDEINIVLINNDNNDKKDDDDNNTDNNENDNTNDDDNKNDNNDDNKSNNDNDDDDDNFQINFISLDDNTQNTLDNHIYDVNPTTESISNNIYYNTISNPKFDFELINAKGQEQKAQQLEAWDLKDLHDENVVGNKNDVLSQKLSENLVNYFQIRQNFDKLTENLHHKELVMDMNFLLSLDDHKGSLGRFDNDIGDLSKILEDLKQDALKLQKLEQNVYVQNLLKDVVQEQFKNNAQK